MTRLLYIDLFCGAGGTSTGVSTATLDGAPCAEVIACVDHDPKAIASHAANHPLALHFTEDIRTLELAPLLAHLARCRAAKPGARIVLWASLECTNFSRAKGGQPRDPDSRTLAEHLYRYIEAIGPDYIQIENVEEFMSWGDLDSTGRPVSRDRGRLYLRWVDKIKRYGYTFDHRILNAADYGAHTSRRRFFGIFARRGLPIAFPVQTHTRDTSGLFRDLQPWRPVREVLDLDDEGTSIFARRKPLAEATLRRLYAGLVKFVAGGKKAFLVKYNSMSRKGKYVPPSLDQPCPTVAVQGRLALASVRFLSKQYGGSPDGKNIPLDGPAGTVTTVDHHVLASVHFLDMQYGNGTHASLETAAGTLTTRPKLNLVGVRYLMNPAANPILPTDSPMTVRIKEFMALYRIADITLRMLRVDELLRIQGFPDGYILLGNQADRKKFIGNAVEVTVARAWCEALCRALREAPVRLSGDLAG